MPSFSVCFYVVVCSLLNEIIPFVTIYIHTLNRSDGQLQIKEIVLPMLDV